MSKEGKKDLKSTVQVKGKKKLKTRPASFFELLSAEGNEKTKSLFVKTTVAIVALPLAFFIVSYFVVLKYMYPLDSNLRVSVAGIAAMISVMIVLVWFLIQIYKDHKEEMREISENKKKLKKIREEKKRKVAQVTEDGDILDKRTTKKE